jgi:hypothetical protein
MGLENSFRPLFVRQWKRKNRNMSVRLGSAKSSVHFMIGDDCVEKRKINI